MLKSQNASNPAGRAAGLSHEQAIDFLETFRETMAGVDEATQLISIRIPKNILRAYKLKAQHEGRSYQTMMVQILRTGL